MRAIFSLVRSKRDAYHPTMEGTICDALREARIRAGEDGAGVSIVWHRDGRPSIESRRIARVPWSRLRGRLLPARFDFVPAGMKLDLDRGC